MTWTPVITASAPEAGPIELADLRAQCCIGSDTLTNHYAGIKLVQAYRREHGRKYVSAIPPNLYGRGDNLDLASSHVLPASIRKAHEAKLAEVQS